MTSERQESSEWELVSVATGEFRITFRTALIFRTEY